MLPAFPPVPISLRPVFPLSSLTPVHENWHFGVRSVCFVKNVEAQVETALRYGEDPSLSDEEMWPLVFRLCRETFQADKPSLLEAPDKKKLAILLKNQYHSSLKDVDAMFPLAGTAQNR